MRPANENGTHKFRFPDADVQTSMLCTDLGLGTSCRNSHDTSQTIRTIPTENLRRLLTVLGIALSAATKTGVGDVLLINDVLEAFKILKPGVPP